MTDDARQAFYRRELLTCEAAWRAGAPEAVADAMHLCEEVGWPPPRWLVYAVRTLARRDLQNNTARKWEMIHFTRWDAVNELRDRRGERHIPKSWADCYAVAADMLKGTPAQGSPDTMKASYQRVQRDRKRGRYYVPMRKLG